MATKGHTIMPNGLSNCYLYGTTGGKKGYNPEYTLQPIT